MTNKLDKAIKKEQQVIENYEHPRNEHGKLDMRYRRNKWKKNQWKYYLKDLMA